MIKKPNAFRKIITASRKTANENKRKFVASRFVKSEEKNTIFRIIKSKEMLFKEAGLKKLYKYYEKYPEELYSSFVNIPYLLSSFWDWKPKKLKNEEIIQKKGMETILLFSFISPVGVNFFPRS